VQCHSERRRMRDPAMVNLAIDKGAYPMER